MASESTSSSGSELSGRCVSQVHGVSGSDVPSSSFMRGVESTVTRGDDDGIDALEDDGGRVGVASGSGGAGEQSSDESGEGSGTDLSEPEFSYISSGGSEEDDPYVDLDGISYPPPLNLWRLADGDVLVHIPEGGDVERLRRRRLRRSVKNVTALLAPRQPLPELLRTLPDLRLAYGISSADIELLPVTRLDRAPRHPSGIRLSVGFFRAGLRLPMDGLIVDVLNYYLRAPAQMTATFYRVMSLLIHLRDDHGYAVDLDEVRAVFVCKPATRGKELCVLQRAGKLTYSLTRRPGLGLFVPPNKHAYKDDQVLEVYGAYEPEVEGVRRELRCKAFTDFDTTGLNTLDPAKPSVSLIKLRGLSIADRRKLLPGFREFFPASLAIVEARCVDGLMAEDKGLAGLPLKVRPNLFKPKRKNSVAGGGSAAKKQAGVVPKSPPVFTILDDEQGEKEKVSVEDVGERPTGPSPSFATSEDHSSASVPERRSASLDNSVRSPGLDSLPADCGSPERNLKLSADAQVFDEVRHRVTALDIEGKYVHVGAHGLGHPPIAAGLAQSVVLDDDLARLRKYSDGELSVGLSARVYELAAYARSLGLKHVEIEDGLRKAAISAERKLVVAEAELDKQLVLTGTLRKAAEEHDGVVASLEARIKGLEEVAAAEKQAAGEVLKKLDAVAEQAAEVLAELTTVRAERDGLAKDLAAQIQSFDEMHATMLGHCKECEPFKIAHGITDEQLAEVPDSPVGELDEAEVAVGGGEILVEDNNEIPPAV